MTWKTRAELIAGAILTVCLPARARHLQATYAIPRTSRRDRVILEWLKQRYYRLSPAEQAALRNDAWSGENGARWHETHAPDLSAHLALLTEIVAHVDAHGPYDLLVEIGTGHGDFAHRIAEALPQQRCIGVDLNAACIASAQTTYPSIAFAHIADLQQWWSTAIAPTDRVLLVAVGTLQYFQGHEFMALLDRAARQPRAGLALSETVNMLDLDTHPQSQPRIVWMGYSHAYPAILRASGWTIWIDHRTTVDPAQPDYQAVRFVATTTRV